jgi:hypothetical protein
MSRKSKYKKIRKRVEDDVWVIDEDVIHSIEDDNCSMSECNSRTCSFSEFKNYLCEKNKMAMRWTKKYEERIFRKLRFNTKINIKRSEDNFINKFKKTYGDGEDVVIVAGDWEERPSVLKGKEPTKGKSMRTLFRNAGYTVYLLDEFRTSKLCCCCHQNNEGGIFTRSDPRPWMSGKTQNVWGLLRCTNGNCRRVHNRDFNSSFNMWSITTSVIEKGKRPDCICRTTLQTYALTGVDKSIMIPQFKN